MFIEQPIDPHQIPLQEKMLIPIAKARKTYAIEVIKNFERDFNELAKNFGFNNEDVKEATLHPSSGDVHANGKNPLFIDIHLKMAPRKQSFINREVCFLMLC